VDQEEDRISGGGLVVHHDVSVTALLEVRIEDRAPAAPEYLGESIILH
jgi:hypothetical protein